MLMESYSEYRKDPKQFPFLKSFQDSWQPIRDEFMQFSQSATLAERALERSSDGP